MTEELFWPTCTDMRKASVCNVRTDKALSHGNCMGRSNGLKDKVPSPEKRQGVIITEMHKQIQMWYQHNNGKHIVKVTFFHHLEEKLHFESENLCTLELKYFVSVNSFVPFA